MTRPQHPPFAPVAVLAVRLAGVEIGLVVWRSRRRLHAELQARFGAPEVSDA